MKNEVAVFGGGCFWCTEAVFKMLNGVISVAPGYAGGNPPAGGKNPTYEEVCSGLTGHAEVIKIEFDPSKILFKNLLAVFFATHDPTTLNRQGADSGTQYRSAIFYSSEEQKNETEKLIKSLNDSSKKGVAIVTELKPLEKFWEAENYHKDYYERNPQNPYCQIVINPKLKKAEKMFAKLLKKQEFKP